MLVAKLSRASLVDTDCQYYIKMGGEMFNKALLAILIMIPAAVVAETDGNELLEMMKDPKGREYAQPFIDDVWQKWNNGLFCIPQENIQNVAFDAVEKFLEEHPEIRFRPRRYVITNALRESFPCNAN
jgi:hypothetical protein